MMMKPLKHNDWWGDGELLPPPLLQKMLFINILNVHGMHYLKYVCVLPGHFDMFRSTYHFFIDFAKQYTSFGILFK